MIWLLFSSPTLFPPTPYPFTLLQPLWSPCFLSNRPGMLYLGALILPVLSDWRISPDLCMDDSLSLLRSYFKSSKAFLDPLFKGPVPSPTPVTFYHINLFYCLHSILFLRPNDLFSSCPSCLWVFAYALYSPWNAPSFLFIWLLLELQISACVASSERTSLIASTPHPLLLLASINILFISFMAHGNLLYIYMYIYLYIYMSIYIIYLYLYHLHKICFLFIFFSLLTPD